jgi:Domain of unknown function (DUF4375)
MYELTIADRIWNRACLEDVSDLREGDRLLAAMLLAHGLVMNGGVLHAVESLDEDQLVAAKEGFRYLGLPDVASLLVEARAIFPAGKESEEHEFEFNKRYYALIPDDSTLTALFEAVLLAKPWAFAPILVQ